MLAPPIHLQQGMRPGSGVLLANLHCQHASLLHWPGQHIQRCAILPRDEDCRLSRLFLAGRHMRHAGSRRTSRHVSICGPDLQLERAGAAPYQSDPLGGPINDLELGAPVKRLCCLRLGRQPEHTSINRARANASARAPSDMVLQADPTHAKSQRERHCLISLRCAALGQA